MAEARGRRTRHVVVYLSATEAAVWDTLRGLEVPWGSPPVSRAEWVMTHVLEQLERIEQSLCADWYKDRARAALAAWDAEQERLGPVDETRAHGHPLRPRLSVGPGRTVVDSGRGAARDGDAP